MGNVLEPCAGIVTPLAHTGSSSAASAVPVQDVPRSRVPCNVEAPDTCWFLENPVLVPLDPRVRLVCSSPKVWLIDDFLNPDIAQLFIADYDHKVVPSRVMKRNGVDVEGVRTSSSVTLNLTVSVLSFRAEIGKILNTDDTNMEPAALVRYEAGQEYLPHFDWFRDGTGRQREWSVVIYLNAVDPDDGGETAFLSAENGPLLIQPKVGRAVFWRNLLPTGYVDTTTMHAGRPPKRGTKYIITLWTGTGPHKPVPEVPD